MANEPAMQSVRAIDVAPLAEMLTRSFLHDPGLAWMVPDEQVRRACLPGFFRAIVRGTMRHGLALRSPGNEAISLLRLPGEIYPGLYETLLGLPAMFPLLQHGASRAQILGKAVREHAPTSPFRYLQFLGVAVESQGRGLGGAAIRAGLEAALHAGEPVYLETPKPANVTLYLHHGFEVVSEWTVEQGGPRFTSMLKRPR